MSDQKARQEYNEVFSSIRMDIHSLLTRELVNLQLFKSDRQTAEWVANKCTPIIVKYIQEVFPFETQAQPQERAVPQPIQVQEEQDDPIRRKLNLLFEYERHYLELIKEYKDEIKFAAGMQEDIRRERSAFFASTLREVRTTLQSTGIGSEMEAHWLGKLISSYTDSLDLSAELAREHTLLRYAELKDESNATKKEIENQ